MNVNFHNTVKVAKKAKIDVAKTWGRSRLRCRSRNRTSGRS